jgi:hypothetical protein
MDKNREFFTGKKTGDLKKIRKRCSKIAYFYAKFIVPHGQ